MKNDVFKKRGNKIPGFLVSILYSFLVYVFLRQCWRKRNCVLYRRRWKCNLWANTKKYELFGL